MEATTAPVGGHWPAGSLCAAVSVPDMSPDRFFALPPAEMAALLRRIRAAHRRAGAAVDFHLRIEHDGNSGMTFCAYFGGPDRDGPLKLDACLSCTGSAATRRVAQASKIREAKTCSVWLDAQGRPMLVATPIDHIESVDDLGDDQLGDLFVSMGAALREHVFPHGQISFVSLIANHGSFRNHRHLHLKCRLEPAVFAAAESLAERHAQIRAMQSDPEVARAIRGH